MANKPVIAGSFRVRILVWWEENKDWAWMPVAAIVALALTLIFLGYLPTHPYWESVW